MSNSGRRTIFALPVLLFALALVVRAPGLGKWCLTVDEFYFYRAVSFVMEKGVPEFPGGGYYTRGIALQYLTALPMLLLSNRELAVRILPLLCGAMAIPLFFLFCRRFLGREESLLCALMLLLSSWHIEFSRFARMYMPFQFVFLLFLLYAHSGFRRNMPWHRATAFALAALAVLVYEGSIIPALLLGVFVLTGDVGRRRSEVAAFAVPLVLLVALNAAANLVKFRHMGVRDALPEQVGVASEKAGLPNLPVVLPDFGLLSSAWSSAAGKAALAVLAIGAAALVVRGFGTVTRGDRPKGLLVFSLLSLSILPLFHQYALFLLLAAIFAMHRDDIREAVGRDLPLWAGYVLLTVVFWTVVTVHSGNLYKIRHFLAGYPPIKYAVVAPFMEAVPMWTVFLFGAVAASLVRNSIFRSNGEGVFPLTILILGLVLVAIFETPYRSTRYSFFLFPLFLIVCMGEVGALRAYVSARAGPGLGRKAGAALLAIPPAVFLATEDFHLRHVYDVSAADLNFRTGAYARFADHWYPRADLKTPGLQMDAFYREGDVVVLEQVAGSLYLRNSFVNYVSEDGDRFARVARREGTEEIWTGRRMISKPGEVAAMVPPNEANALWVVGVVRDFPGGSLHLDRRHEELAREFGLNIELAFVGIDGRIGVWRIKRTKGRSMGSEIRRRPGVKERGAA